MNYITSTYILDCLPKNTIVVNNPTAVRNSTEKIYTFQFSKFMAPTIVTQKVEDIKKFFLNHKDIIIKPLYGNGGEGIYRCKDGKINGFDIRKHKNAFLESVRNMNTEKDKQINKTTIFNVLVRFFCLYAARQNGHIITIHKPA